MTLTANLAVIGVDGRPLTDAARQHLAASTLVVGAARHLESLPLPSGAQKVVLGELKAGLAALDAHEGKAVVLASGDPGFFGIVRILRERGTAAEIFPAVGAISTICARVGVTWDDAVVVSAHGRGADGLRRAVNACRAHPKVAVLTAPGSGPAELAAALTDHARSLVVGERLGSSAEAVTHCTLQDAATRSWADPNVVLVLAAASASHGPGWSSPARQPPAGWALPETRFEHRDRMVTKSEVRALALARLAPGLGDLIWDIGAGSGSVAIECARFGAAVTAVESDIDQCGRISRNASTFEVEVEVIQGLAPKALKPLADPDGVFIGGGGADVVAIVNAAATRGPRAIVVTLAAVERVGAVMAALREAGYVAGGVQLSAARLAPLPGDATRLAAENPVFLLWGER